MKAEMNGQEYIDWGTMGYDIRETGLNFNDYLPNP
jgi:hypothetical protein